MSTVRIGFTGNRYGLNQSQIEEIKKIIESHDNIIVSHGDCVGSDTEFHNICVSYKEQFNKNISIHIYPSFNPVMRAFNKGDVIMKEKQYLQRNLDIINNSDMLIACPVDKNVEEMRSGTWVTIRHAKKQGMTIHIL